MLPKYTYKNVLSLIHTHSHMVTDSLLLYLISLKALGKADIADILKEKTGISKKDIETILTAFAETVQSEVRFNR